MICVLKDNFGYYLENALWEAQVELGSHKEGFGNTGRCCGLRLWRSNGGGQDWSPSGGISEIELTGWMMSRA